MGAPKKKHNVLQQSRFKEAYELSGCSSLQKFADKLNESEHLVGYRYQYAQKILNGDTKEVPNEVAQAIEDVFGIRAAYVLGIDDFKTQQDVVEHLLAGMHTGDMLLNALSNLTTYKLIGVQRLRANEERTVVDNEIHVISPDGVTEARISGEDLEQLRREVTDFVDFKLFYIVNRQGEGTGK